MRGAGGGLCVRAHEVVGLLQQFGAGVHGERRHIRHVEVAGDECIEIECIACITFLGRTLRKGVFVPHARKFRVRKGVLRGVVAVERDEGVEEREALLERLVGNRLAVEVHDVVHDHVEESGTVGVRKRTVRRELLPVVHAEFLQLVRMGEHLRELLLERLVQTLRRPRRLVRGGRIGEFGGARPAPAPGTRLVAVDVREVELEHALQLGGRGVDARRKGRQPVLRRIVADALLHIRARDDGACGARPIPLCHGLALDLLEDVRRRARESLAHGGVVVVPRNFS